MPHPDQPLEKKLSSEVSNDPVPDAAKPVLKGRLLGEEEKEFVPSNPLPAPDSSRCAMCDQMFEDGDATIFDETIGVCHTECLEGQAAPVEVAADPKNEERQTPLDQLLSSIASTQGDAGDLAVIYIKRKPDPVGTTFKSPYNGSTKTIGELPFDESFVSQAVIELTTARIHGGGYYQWQVYCGGTYKRGWSAIVDDPVAKPEVTAALDNNSSTLTASGAPPVMPDNFQIFKRQAEEFAEVAKAFGLAPRGAQQRTEGSYEPPPPANPLESITTSIALVKSVMDLAKDMNPAPASNGGGERTTADTIIEASRELGIGDAIREFVKPLAAVGGALVADAIAQSRARKAAEARAAMTNNAPVPPFQPGQMPNVGAPTVQASPESFAPSPHVPPAHLQQPPAPQVAAPEPFDEQTREFLRPMVGDMVKGNEGGVDRAVQSLIGMIALKEMLGDDVRPFIESEVISKSGYELLGWLGDGNPEWKQLRISREASDYIAFLDDFCEAAQEALQEIDAQDGGGEGAGEDVTRETLPGGAEILEFVTPGAREDDSEIQTSSAAGSLAMPGHADSPNGIETAPAADVSQGGEGGKGQGAKGKEPTTVSRETSVSKSANPVKEPTGKGRTK